MCSESGALTNWIVPRELQLGESRSSVSVNVESRNYALAIKEHWTDSELRPTLVMRTFGEW